MDGGEHMHHAGAMCAGHAGPKCTAKIVERRKKKPCQRWLLAADRVLDTDASLRKYRYTRFIFIRCLQGVYSVMLFLVIHLSHMGLSYSKSHIRISKIPNEFRENWVKGSVQCVFFKYSEKARSLACFSVHGFLAPLVEKSENSYGEGNVRC